MYSFPQTISSNIKKKHSKCAENLYLIDKCLQSFVVYEQPQVSFAENDPTSS